MSQSQQGFWGLVCLPVGFLHRIHRNSHIPTWRVLLCAQLWKQKNLWALHQPLGLHQGLLCFLANKELRDLHILFPAQLLGLVCAGRIHPAINPCSSSVSKQASEAAEIKLKFVFSALLGFFFFLVQKEEFHLFRSTFPCHFLMELFLICISGILLWLQCSFFFSWITGCERCLCPGHKPEVSSRTPICELSGC